MAVLLDATPLAEGHARRGIGVAVAGLLSGLAGLPEKERPVLLARGGQTVPEGFSVRRVSWRSVTLPRVPEIGPRRVGARAAGRRRERIFHATRHELIPAGPGVVATCHDLIPAMFPGQYLAGASRIPERAAYRHFLTRLAGARLIVVPSQETADDVADRLGIPSERIRVVPHGTPPSALPVGERPAGPYLLYAGALDPHKNPELAIDVLAAVPAEVRLVMTGPWAPRRLAGLRRRAEATGVATRIDWRGWQPEGALAALRAGASAALITSRKEGFGLPVLEAMQAGTPVIAADIPSLRETGGEAAEYCDLGLVGEWASAVRRLLDDPAVAARASAAGRRRAAEFTWERAARDLRDIWREAADL